MLITVQSDLNAGTQTLGRLSLTSFPAVLNAWYIRSQNRPSAPTSEPEMQLFPISIPILDVPNVQSFGQCLQPLGVTHQFQTALSGRQLVERQRWSHPRAFRRPGAIAVPAGATHIVPDLSLPPILDDQSCSIIDQPTALFGRREPALIGSGG